tara:strand:- start:339 stop:761 length:423 start_codon:yes stop_codon:yes gene_type:complete
MKKISLIILVTLMSVSLFGLKVTSDEKFTLSGKVTSIVLTDQGGVINVSSKAGRYGKVFLTYNLKRDNPNNDAQGSFSGRGVGISDDGNRNAGSRQGVWKREGNIITFHSLDDVTDGNRNFCISKLNLSDETLEMTFYPF